MSNRQLEEMQEELVNQKLASELGISYDELLELEWDIDTDESNDGLIYGYMSLSLKNPLKRSSTKLKGYRKAILSVFSHRSLKKLTILSETNS